MLRLEHLAVRYGPIAAVQDLTLRCAEGEVIALIGPNGAGKSSTLLAVAGAAAGEVSGQILLDGEELRGRSPEAIVRAGIALVPEGRRIFGTLSVEENLLLGATLRRNRRDIRTHVRELEERFPILGVKRRHPAGLLSGGEQQQLAIARALLSRPRLLLLDEPSLGLAPRIVDEIFDLVDALRGEGTTIVLVEQNALRALEVSDRCYVLHHGRLQVEGRSEALLSDADFADVYFGGTTVERTVVP